METTTRRLPLRAVDPKALAELHARYETYTQAPPRPLARTIDKPVERMTLWELQRTQWDEPPTESRRCWLATGQGALSLDGGSDDPEAGSLAETVQDEHDAARFGVSYATLDPAVLAKIEWEREVNQSGECITFTREAGRLVVDRYVDRPTWRRLLVLAEQYDAGNGTGQYHRLTPDALREARRRAWQNLRAAEAQHRQLADPEWHAGYERTRKGEVTGIVAHGSRPLPRTTGGTAYAPWHGAARDATELELGTHLMSDDELEATLGRVPSDD